MLRIYNSKPYWLSDSSHNIWLLILVYREISNQTPDSSKIISCRIPPAVVRKSLPSSAQGVCMLPESYLLWFRNTGHYWGPEGSCTTSADCYVSKVQKIHCWGHSVKAWVFGSSYFFTPVLYPPFHLCFRWIWLFWFFYQDPHVFVYTGSDISRQMTLWLQFNLWLRLYL